MAPSPGAEVSIANLRSRLPSDRGLPMLPLQKRRHGYQDKKKIAGNLLVAGANHGVAASIDSFSVPRSS